MLRRQGTLPQYRSISIPGNGSAEVSVHGEPGFTVNTSAPTFFRTRVCADSPISASLTMRRLSELTGSVLTVPYEANSTITR